MEQVALSPTTLSRDTIQRLQDEMSDFETTKKDPGEETQRNILDAIEIIQEALIDLYLNVKVRTKEEVG